MEIRFRKENKGIESEMVKDFLKNQELFFDENLEYTVLKEAFAEVGIPDILIIAWDKKGIESWSPCRNKLVKSDLKIMHHISSFKKRGILKSTLAKQLGFSEKQIQKSISTLSDAKLIDCQNTRVFIRDLQTNFFIRQIITVEAKMKNWRSAFRQAQLNENFSSHSYVLLPKKIISQSVVSSFNSKIGLIAQDGEKVVLKKKARKAKLPASYFSWVINEHVGRQVSNKKLCLNN